MSMDWTRTCSKQVQALTVRPMHHLCHNVNVITYMFWHMCKSVTQTQQTSPMSRNPDHVTIMPLGFIVFSDGVSSCDDHDCDARSIITITYHGILSVTNRPLAYPFWNSFCIQQSYCWHCLSFNGSNCQ